MKDLKKIEINLEKLCLSIISSVNDISNISPTTINSLIPLFNEMNTLVKVTTIEDSLKLIATTSIATLSERVRLIRAAYELEIEKRHALKLLNEGISGANLAKIITIPYANSAIFDTIIQNEISQNCKSCLIVGSGPLPATALLFLGQHNISVTCLDISDESTLLSTRILDAISIYPEIRHITSDILDWRDFSSFDFIFINGLVGIKSGSTNKCEIVDHVCRHKSKNCLLMLRIGYGLNQLYYPSVKLPLNIMERAKTIYPSSLERSGILYFEI